LLCKQYFNVNDTFISRISNSREYKNEFQKLWLFIYEIAFELKNKGKEYDPDAYFIKYAASYTSICLNLNISGFVDDGCLGIIFPNEPCQGVLFKDLREITGNLKIIPIYQKYDTAPNIDNSNNDNKNNVSPAKYKEKYESYLAKKLNVNYVTIYSTDYSTLIKNHKPFIVLANNILYFVNKDGNLTVGGVDTDNIFNNNNNVDASDSFSSERTAYFNTSYGTEYTSVDAFGRYGGDVAYAVKNEGNGGVFINKEGKPDISNIDPDEINDGYRRAEYFNQLLGENKFEKVGKFENYGGEITMATILSSGESIFINRKGDPDISGADITKITNTEALTTLINQKLGKQVYKTINTFGKFGEDIAFATDINGKKEFIDKEGKSNLGNVDINKINDDKTRAVYVNKLLGTEYKAVSSFNAYGENVAYVTTGDKNFFINKQGKPDVSNVILENIGDRHIRATYFNQKNGTDYAAVYEYGTYGNDVALATDDNGRIFFINKEGNPDTTNVDFEQIKNNDRLLATYFNTINGTDFKDITQPSKTIKTNVFFASLSNGGFMFVNKKGKPTIKVTNLEQLNSYYGGDTIADVIINTKKAIAGKLKENYSVLHSIINEELINYFQK
jgi:hypothetical protein